MATTKPLEYVYIIQERVPNALEAIDHYATLSHYKAIGAVKDKAKEKLIEHGGEAEESLTIYPYGQVPEDKKKLGYVIYVQAALGASHIYNVKKFTPGWIYNSDDLLCTLSIKRVLLYNREKQQEAIRNLAAAPARIVVTDSMDSTMKKEAENREQLHDQLSQSLKKRQDAQTNTMTSSVFGELKLKNIIDPYADNLNNELVKKVLEMEKRRERLE